MVYTSDFEWYAECMEMLFDIPVMTCKDLAAWERWLGEHYDDQTGIWLKIAKKNSGIESVAQPDALDACLCYGWIDGQRRSYDENYYLQKYTPRRKKSLWSKVNIAKVEALIADGRMQAPGLAEIEKAKSDGRWDAAYESQRNAVDPDDLLEAFKTYPKAKVFYDSLTRAEKYSVLWRLMTSKTPEVRAARLKKMIEKLEDQQKI